MPYINGFRHIDKIANAADVSVSIVVQCVRHLTLLGVAVLVPVFQYSNIYRPTPKLRMLAKCPDVQQRAIEKCSKSELKKAKIRDILLLFASMTHGATLGELCVRFNPAKHNIDERNTVLFGLVEQLIRPIYKYPVAVSKNLFVGYEDHNSSAASNSFCIPISNKRQSVDSVKITRNSFTGLKTLGKSNDQTDKTSNRYNVIYRLSRGVSGKDYVVRSREMLTNRFEKKKSSGKLLPISARNISFKTIYSVLPRDFSSLNAIPLKSYDVRALNRTSAIICVNISNNSRNSFQSPSIIRISLTFRNAMSIALASP